jgi:hypothetical protein
MKKSSSLFAIPVAVLAVLALSMLSEALILPDYFHGKVIVNSMPAPNGTQIRGMVDGSDHTSGSYFTTTEGLYGDESYLVITGDSVGQTIVFEVKRPGDLSFNAAETTLLEYNFCENVLTCGGDIRNLTLNVTIEGPVCTDGQTLDCPLQAGVCSDSQQTCTGGQWPGCDASNYGPDYEEDELTCDSLDNDCDGETDEGYNVGESCSVGIGECEASGSYVCTQDGLSTECDAVPGDPDPEVCDGLDNDCNGLVDDGDVCPFCTDNDQDGYGDPASSVCDHPELDCDDGDANINPGATELCDGVDNDCDGQTDEGYNVGESCSAGVGECEASGSYVCTQDGLGTECDAVPGEPSQEVCDFLDNDCDGEIDNGFDQDGDGYTTCEGDCDDSNVEINPAAEEICDNQIDDDCDGDVDYDDLECFCIEITDLAVLDMNFSETDEIEPGEMYHVRVTNENVCDYDIVSMQIVEIKEGETPINLGTVTSTIEAFDSSVITFGFVLPLDTAEETINVNAYNWNQWIDQPGDWEALSEDASTSFESVAPSV